MRQRQQMDAIVPRDAAADAAAARVAAAGGHPLKLVGRTVR